MAESHELDHIGQRARMARDHAYAPAEEHAAENETGTQAQDILNKGVVRKLDLLLLPFLSLFFLVNSLDRSNIGNAETANFTADTGLQPQDLNTATACFFAFFVALQPLGAACGRYFGMRLWVPSCMVIWGLLTMLHIWINAKWQLITIRIFIGALEAGFYPVTVSYLSQFYTRYEFARRLGVFYAQYALAGALGGILAYVVFSMYPHDASGDNNAWKSWQVLFLIEGSLTVVIAVIGFFWLPNRPDTAWFFNSAQKQWAGTRILLDRTQITSSSTKANETNEDRHDHPTTENENAALLNEEAPSSSLHLKRTLTEAQGLAAADVISAFTDWKVFYLLAVNMLSAIPAAAFTVFLPLIVRGFGFSSTAANLFTAPPFVLGALVLWLFTWWSDRRRERFIPILYGLAILISGLTAVAMLSHEWIKLRYLALCVLLGGSFVASPLTIAWFTGDIEAPGKRAVVLGINGWGNLAGVFSSLLFAPKYAPDYQTPFFVTLSLVMVSFVGFMLFRKLLFEENRKRQRIVAAWDTVSHEMEATHGLGPYEQKSSHSLITRLLKQCFHVEAEQRGRHGEDKLTYTYGL